MEVFVTPRESPALSRTSSFRSNTSGNFLGVNTTSRWLDWSRQRRVSFKQRIDAIEEKQREQDSKRVSTPIRKARNESVMFVSAELEDQHIIKEDDEGSDGAGGHDNLKHKFAVGAKKVRQIAIDSRHEVKLSMNQWNTLMKFWEHDLFVRCRLAGVLLSFMALVFGVISISNDNWIYQQDFNANTTTNAGLWFECIEDVSSRNCTNFDSSDFQIPVTGLLIFAMAFGSLALILSLCGVCTVTLPKKVYYYHSAGEIYLMCSLACLAALIVYPMAMTIHGDDFKFSSLGMGYGLGWGSAVMFFVTATCMCLDDLVRHVSSMLCCSNQPPSRSNMS